MNSDKRIKKVFAKVELNYIIDILKNSQEVGYRLKNLSMNENDENAFMRKTHYNAIDYAVKKLDEIKEDL